MKTPKPRQLPSGKWFVQLRIGGRSVSITEDTEARARARAMAVKSGLLKAKEKPVTITVGEALDQYIEERANILSPCTIRSYKHIRKYRFKDIIDKNVSALTKSQIQSAVNREAALISYKTLKNALGLFRSAVSDYLTCDISRLTLPAKTRRNINTYTKDDLAKLFEAVKGDPIELAVLMAACLGLRRSEILGLRYEDFDKESCTVKIHCARVPDESNKLIEKTTKTPLSTRELDCPAFIMEKVGQGSGYLYNQHKQNYILARLKRLCELHKLPDITLHGLRHTNASVMLAIGIPDKYAMERGGWSNNQTMKNIYQHTMDDYRKAADLAVNNYFQDLFSSPENGADDESEQGEKNDQKEESANDFANEISRA